MPASRINMISIREKLTFTGRLGARYALARHSILAAVFAFALLAGCAAGPNYKPPQTSVPASFSNGVGTNLNAADPLAAWWRSFEDARLSSLVDRALTNNHDIRIAVANLQEARALRRQAQFDLLPVATPRAGYTRTLSSQSAVFGFPRQLREVGLYNVGFDATWEIDLFGRTRRSVEAATASTEAAESSLRDARISLIGELARNYFELRGAQNELAVSQRNAVNQRETLHITEARLEGGRGTQLDVARASAQLNTTLATIPPLQQTAAHAIHRLSVLAGQQPTALASELQPPASLPNLPPMVLIGNPEGLLRRRPDVRVAERALAAATARIGINTADLFPRVTFNGRLGLEAGNLAGLDKGGADTWSFGPSITWAALDYGHVRARIKAAGARADAALAAYERTVLTTLEETEDALVDFGQEQARRDFLSESVKSSETAATLARQRYENGATDFLTVLDAERVLLEAQVQFAQSQTRTATALVSVYKALGGGWEPSEPPPARQ
jgi:multidrug efflux system outer membrane protein